MQAAFILVLKLWILSVCLNIVGRKFEHRKSCTPPTGTLLTGGYWDGGESKGKFMQGRN